MPPDPVPPADRDEAFWRDYLTNYDRAQAAGRRFFNRLPSSPRCQLCAAPFGGAGGTLMHLLGKRQSSMNPNMCNACETHIQRHRGGATVPGAMLFADIRGSTALAESMSARDFHDLLSRFYAASSAAVFGHDGLVDKFVGDEIVAVFPPMLSIRPHAARAIGAGQAILRTTGHAAEDGPWVGVGAAVHSGLAWFGAVGDEQHVEVTVLGDAVNTTARLASLAGPGELLVSTDAAGEAGLDGDFERRTLALRGKQAPIEVLVLGATSTTAAEPAAASR